MNRPAWMIDIDGVPLARGLFLRTLLVLALLDAARPMTVATLERQVAAAGYCVAGRPSKAISDALRAEVAHGRVVRAGRGTYAVGRVAKVTQHRMRARVAAMRNHAAPAEAMARHLQLHGSDRLSLQCGTDTTSMPARST